MLNTVQPRFWLAFKDMLMKGLKYLTYVVDGLAEGRWQPACVL